jgi:hypothetical protein
MNYFMIGGDKREYGPVDAELIRQWLREGRANGDTLARLENETELRPLRTFPEFFAASGPVLPPPLPAGAAAGEKPLEMNFDTPISVRHAFGRAWHLVSEHFVEILGACMLVWMALTAMLFVPGVGSIFTMIFHGLFFGGLFMFFLKLIREGDATPGDVFSLPYGNGGALIAAGIVTSLLTQFATVCLCVVPGIYLEIAWLFTIPLVADKGLNLWPALTVSRKVISRFWFRMFALFLLAFLPVVVFHLYLNARMTADTIPYIHELLALLGDSANANDLPNKVQVIATKIEDVETSYGSWALARQALLLISMPVGIASIAFVYEDIFGPKK